MKTSLRATLAVFSFAIALLFLSATALPAGAAPEEEITPSTAVARLKISKGTAWVRPADSMEWEEYSHNFPVVERARVSIPKDSEAEIQFRGSQYLLLEGGSEVDVRQLGERKASFRLRTGRAAFSLPKEDFAPVTVKLPGDRDVSLDAPGLYWLTVDGQVSKLDIRRGGGTVSGEGVSPVAVAGGEEASIGKEVTVSKAGRPETRPPAEPTLTEAERKAGIPGSAATELRGHGEWVWTSEYGYVWRPNVTDDWAPYYYGRWAWVYPYGWNWVGYEPWGWWPYHYGWWVTVGAWGWVWAPCSFYSGGYYYHGYPYSYHYGHYNSANVRFENDGRHVRWVPEQPGRGETRPNSANNFSRTDTRLAQWNQPMSRGAASSRGSEGRVPSAGGQVAAAPSSAQRGAGQATRPSPAGGGRVSAVPAGSGATGGSYGRQGYSSPYRQGSGYTGSAGPRSSAGPSGYTSYPSTRGSVTGYGSYGGGGYRGYSGGSGNFGGSGGRGGGYSGGGGGRTR